MHWAKCDTYGCRKRRNKLLSYQTSEWYAYSICQTQYSYENYGPWQTNTSISFFLFFLILRLDSFRSEARSLLMFINDRCFIMNERERSVPLCALCTRPDADNNNRVENTTCSKIWAIVIPCFSPQSTTAEKCKYVRLLYSNAAALINVTIIDSRQTNVWLNQQGSNRLVHLRVKK